MVTFFRLFVLLSCMFCLIACQPAAPPPSTPTVNPPTATSQPAPTETPLPLLTETATARPTEEPQFEALRLVRNEGKPVERLTGLRYTVPLQPGIASQQVDIYRPVTQQPLSVAILFHGSGEGKGDIADWAEDVAAQGLLVYAANWPVPPLSRIDERNEKRMREAAESMHCMVAFGLATAEQYGGRQENMTIAGFSAGALLGSAVVLAGPDWLDAWEMWGSDHDGPPAQTSCAIAVDGTNWPTNFVGVGGPFNLFETVFGPPASLNERQRGLYELLSPVALLESANGATIRLVHGSGDSRVGISQSRSFALAAERAGLDAALDEVAGAGHTTINATTAPLIYALSVD